MNTPTPTPVPAPPQPDNPRTARWTHLLAEPRAHPGQWFRLPGHYDGSVTVGIKTGRYTTVKAGEFDARSVRNRDVTAALGKKRYDVYVCYIGDTAGA